MSVGQVILVVDDDAHIRQVVSFALTKAGYTVIEAGDGKEALARYRDSRPALIVLDILMPEMDGVAVCREIRSHSRMPIIFLSSRDDEIDRIVGLEIGGDDYITKPFSPRELVARVGAVLRRAGEAATGPEKPAATDDSSILRHGRLRMDPDLFKAFWGNVEVVLTVTEFALLKTLMAHPGKVYTRDQLMDGAYADDNFVTDRTIDSHVRRVRRKFAAAGGDPIETVHGAGYRLGACR